MLTFPLAMTAENITGFCAVWCIFGLMIWCFVTDDGGLDEDDMSIPQLVLVRALAGPLLWLYSLYQVLGLFGRRS